MVDPNQKQEQEYIGYDEQKVRTEFERLWLSYPMNRRNRMDEAFAIYQKAVEKGATSAAMLEALNEAKNSYDWSKENGQYIPGIVKWLQREPWRNYVRAEASGQFQEEQLWTTE